MPTQARKTLTRSRPVPCGARRLPTRLRRRRCASWRGALHPTCHPISRPPFSAPRLPATRRPSPSLPKVPCCRSAHAGQPRAYPPAPAPAQIRSRFPDHGVFGEEGGLDAGAGEWRAAPLPRLSPRDFRHLRPPPPSRPRLASGWDPPPIHPTPTHRTWVLDPIDGTKSFITGKPLFGTLIALVHSATGRPVVGVIDQPVLKERRAGARQICLFARAPIPVCARRRTPRLFAHCAGGWASPEGRPRSTAKPPPPGRAPRSARRPRRPRALSPAGAAVARPGDPPRPAGPPAGHAYMYSTTPLMFDAKTKPARAPAPPRRSPGAVLYRGAPCFTLTAP